MTDKYQVIIPPGSSVEEFEEMLLHRAEQEQIRGVRGRGVWTPLAEDYLWQKERLELYPAPEDFNEEEEDVEPPIMKPVFHNTLYPGEMIRWGLRSRVGNYRILYMVHQYTQVVLLHYFEKGYNGLIKRRDIEPAEETYIEFSLSNPSFFKSNPTL